jgi:ElaB/YqjD/DUF883 family membrane-anchored ribosome-binding protein
MNGENTIDKITGTGHAKEKLSELSEQAAEKTRTTALKADQCVHEHTWMAVAATALAGFVLGLLLRQRNSERWE